jgi:hypothetical protein
MIPVFIMPGIMAKETYGGLNGSPPMMLLLSQIISVSTPSVFGLPGDTHSSISFTSSFSSAASFVFVKEARTFFNSSRSPSPTTFPVSAVLTKLNNTCIHRCINAQTCNLQGLTSASLPTVVTSFGGHPVFRPSPSRIGKTADLKIEYSVERPRACKQG